MLPVFTTKAPTIENISAGGDATLTIKPDGRRIRKIHVHADENGGGGAVATIALIEVIVGNRVIRRMTPTQYADILDFNGAGTFGSAVEASTYFQIAFCEEWRRTAPEEDALGLGTGGIVGNVQVKFTLVGAITNITLEAWIEYDYPKTNGVPLVPGKVTRIERATLPHNAAGFYDWQALPVRGNLMRLHFFSQYVDEVRIEADGGLVLFDSTLAAHNQVVSRYGFNPAANVFQIAFDVHQRLLAADGTIGGINLAELSGLKVSANGTAGVTNYDVLMEIVDTI